MAYEINGQSQKDLWDTLDALDRSIAVLLEDTRTSLQQLNTLTLRRKEVQASLASLALGHGS